MARSPDLLGSANTFLATPNQASKLLNLDSAHPVRGKNLFLVQFTGVTDGRDLTFIVKATDRPSPSPQIEEVDQYGKKRLVVTGVKYEPITMTFYDTADGLAQKIWAEYMAYHFGDFTQKDAAAFGDDMLLDSMKGNDTGFGFYVPPTSKESPDGNGSQFFIDGIQIYQVWGREYIKTTLINPRIASFEADPFDYEDSSPSTIRMSVRFEGVLYANNGAPIAFAEDASLDYYFSDGFNGNVHEVSGAIRKLGFATAPKNDAAGKGTDDKGIGGALSKIFGKKGGEALSKIFGKTNSGGVGGGALGAFGTFDFGSFAAQSVTRMVNNGSIAGLGGDLAYALTGSTSVQQILNTSKQLKNGTDIARAVLGALPRDNGVSSALLDVASIALAPDGKGKLAGQLVGSLLGSGPSGSPVDKVLRAATGIALSSEAYAVQNAKSKPSVQIGNNTANKATTTNSNSNVSTVWPPISND